MVRHTSAAVQVSVIQVDTHKEAVSICCFNPDRLLVIRKSTMSLRCIFLRHIAEHTLLECVVVHADKVDDIRGQCVKLTDCIGVCDFCADNLSAILSSPRAEAITKGFARRTASEELCRRCGYAQRFV